MHSFVAFLLLMVSGGIEFHSSISFTLPPQQQMKWFAAPITITASSTSAMP